jgi:hypothetical protein
VKSVEDAEGQGELAEDGPDRDGVQHDLLGCPKISQGLSRNSFRPTGVFWGTIDWKYIES